MGHQRVLWYKRRGVTLTFTPRGKLFEILITSKCERTRDGLGPGVAMSRIKKIYPDACTTSEHCVVLTGTTPGRQVSTQFNGRKRIEVVDILFLLPIRELVGH